LTKEARTALSQLKSSRVTLLNQSVLLNGVNASIECLSSLFQELYEAGVIPYYLHHPDWTPGTFHFRVSIEKGRELTAQLQGLLPGPALPDYILDIPQGYGKISLLKGEVKKIEEFSANKMEHPKMPFIQGALYEVPTPQTREESKSPHRYLDLHPEYIHSV
jgi:lysine 2,3-aminomutase